MKTRCVWACVLTDAGSLTLKGATVLDFDPYLWYGKLLGGYRQPWHLDAQRKHLAKAHVPSVVRHVGRPSMRSARSAHPVDTPA